MCFHSSLNVFRLIEISQINHQSVTTIGLHQSSKSPPLMTLTHKNHEDFSRLVMGLGKDNKGRITFGYVVLMIQNRDYYSHLKSVRISNSQYNSIKLKPQHTYTQNFKHLLSNFSILFQSCIFLSFFRIFFFSFFVACIFFFFFNAQLNYKDPFSTKITSLKSPYISKSSHIFPFKTKLTKHTPFLFISIPNQWVKLIMARNYFVELLNKALRLKM